MTEERTRITLEKVALRVALCVGVLLVGVVAMRALKSLKKPPAQAAVEERALKVEVLTAKPEDVPVTITGYGTARALNHVRISPEVAGTVVDVHARQVDAEPLVIPRL